MNFWVALAGWLVMFVVLFFISSWMEKNAALRGTHRKTLPWYYEKGLKFFFLLLWMWPLLFVLPTYVVLGMLVVYCPFFLDGVEKRGRIASIFKGDGLLGFAFAWVIRHWQVGFESEGGYKLTDDEFKGKSFIISVCPHGLLPIASMVNVMHDLSPMADFFGGGADTPGAIKRRSIAASMCFMTPLYGDFLKNSGTCDASRYNARGILDDGYSICVVPGGATEALYADPACHAAYIKKRKGFVKLAIETGASLVPTYSFGENKLFSQMRSSWPWVGTLQRKFQAVFGISLPLVTNLIPHAAKITTVAARPIHTVKNDNPSDAEIQEVLDKFIAALQRVFNEFAPKYEEDENARTLQII